MARRLVLIVASLLVLGGCGTVCMGDGSGLDAPDSQAPAPHSS